MDAVNFSANGTRWRATPITTEHVTQEHVPALPAPGLLFTSAEGDSKGLFLSADGGTLFLDEITEMSAHTQAKLLRAIEQKEILPVGANEAICVEARVLAATNKDLKKLVSEGKFRDDLFYRLSVVTVDLPPLRERRDDIPLLVKSFLDEFSRENGKQVRELTPEAMNMLLAYDWPGNVRELRNAVEQMVVLARGERLTVRDVPVAIRGDADLTKINVVRVGMTVEDAERQLIVQALKETDGNRTKAATLLGVWRPYLLSRIKKLGIVTDGPDESDIEDEP